MSGHGTHDGAARNDAIALAHAFAKARWRMALASASIEFGVGDRVPAIEAWSPAMAYAVVTAWNPAAMSRSMRDNEDADARLAARIDALGHPRTRSWSQAHDGSHREAGWLIAGIDTAQAIALGHAFAQAGVLAWRAGEPLRLRMLTRGPKDAALAHVDWLE